MDDDLQQLEAELKRLRPADPSRELLSRIEHDIGASPARRRVAPIVWLCTAALPIAAAVAIAVVRFSPRPAARTGPTGEALASRPAISRSTSAAPAVDVPLKPIAAENVLLSASDEGLVTLDDGTPARRERLQYVDTITWKNPRTNASLTWRVPREEVRVIPVSFQ